jgi:hypothetical protein
MSKKMQHSHKITSGEKEMCLYVMSREVAVVLLIAFITLK